MSCFIVAKAHIAAMVQYALDNGIIDIGQADATGLELWRENHHSYNYRYPTDAEAIPNDYTHERTPAVTPLMAGKLAACWDYQSCEHPAFQQSQAYRIGKAIECDALRRLGTADLWKVPGVDALPWALDSVDQLPPPVSIKRTAREMSLFSLMM